MNSYYAFYRRVWGKTKPNCIWTLKKISIFGKEVSSFYRISGTVHSTIHIIGNLNWFSVKYKLESKGFNSRMKVSVLVNWVFVYVHACKSIVCTSQRWMSHKYLRRICKKKNNLLKEDLETYFRDYLGMSNPVVALYMAT